MTNIVDGIYWTTKSGEQKWSTGNQVFEKIDKDVAAAFKRHKGAYREDLETIVEALGVKFGEERQQLRDDVRRTLLNYRESLADMAAELATVRKLRIELIEELDAKGNAAPPGQDVVGRNP